MRYHKIHSQIWNDENFIKLTSEQQRLFLYCLTCPHSNLIGLYILKPGYVCEDLKRTEKEFKKDIQVLSEHFLSYDETLSVIYMHNFLTHNPITNPNQIKAARKMFQCLPKSSLLLEFSRNHPTLTEGLTEGLNEVLAKASASLGYMDKEKDKEKVKETEEDREAKIIPYVEIIKDLNERTGKNYLSSTEGTRDMIKVLWRQGFLLEHFKKVHANMAAKWKDDAEMNQYLRPATLYQPKKFEGYLNQSRVQGQFPGASKNSAAALSMIEELRKEKESDNVQA